MGQVQVQSDVLAWDQFVCMPGLGQVMGRVVMRADIEGRLPDCQEPSAIVISQGRPTDIGPIPIFLGRDIGHQLAANRVAMDAHTRALFSIGVGFMRAAPVPGELLAFSRQDQLDPNTCLLYTSDAADDL